MLSYAIKRIAQALLVLWAAFTVSFLLLQALPGDAVLIKFLGSDFGLDPNVIEQLRFSYGADATLAERYVTTLTGFLRGDLGYSLHAGIPVAEALAPALPATLSLAVCGFIAAFVLALLLTWLSFLPGMAFLHGFFRSVPSLLVSVPVFWLGILLIQVFSFQLGWVSVINPEPWEALVLPTLTLAVPIAAPLAQLLIRNFDAVLASPFVVTARAKGAGQHWVLLFHVARNAVLPVLTVGGLLLGELLVGAVVTETVFGLNGLGRLTEVSVDNQDVAVLQAIVVMAAAGFVLTNLVVDFLYPVLDPRLRHRSGVLS
ncbi:MAG: ABC transporter permease [Alcaligenaceae bacterium]|nr:ABC transporter permease [Alcaligenaceae bacterium]